jgi:hypothetical protein
MLLYLLFALNAFFVVFLSAYVVKLELQRLRRNESTAQLEQLKRNSKFAKVHKDTSKKISKHNRER